MNLKTIKGETGTYVEIPRNRITFKSKEAEIIFDLTLENDELRLKNQELKKQINEYQKELEKADNLTQICIFKGKEESNISYRKCLNTLDKKETQQKEFIKWLEDKIKFSVKPTSRILLKSILANYKEIIGE